MDKKIKNLLDRVNNDGITFTKPDRQLKNIPQKYGCYVFTNRRLGESVIIDKKRINELINNAKK